MNIVQITKSFAVALVLVMTATGVWATGASDSDDSPAAADKETVFDPATGRTWGPRQSMAEHSRGPPITIRRELTPGMLLPGRITSSVVSMRG